MTIVDFVRLMRRHWALLLVTGLIGVVTAGAYVLTLPYEPALVPSAPQRTNLLLNLLMGLGAGLVLGAVIAFVRHQFDVRVRSQPPVEETTGGAVLGIVPETKDLKRQRTAGAISTLGHAGESLRHLRTNLRFVNVDEPPQAVVITSPSPGEGRHALPSTVTRNVTGTQLVGLPTRTGVVDAAQHLARSVRVPELLVGLSMPFWRYSILPGLPTDVVVFALVITACSFARPTVRIPQMPWVALLYFSMLGFVTAVSLVMDQPWLQRSFRLALLFLLAVAVARGRLRWKSVLVGGVLSLTLLNTPAFYLGLTPDNYPPYLTGWLGDKNVAGMYYAIFAVLGLCLLVRRRQQLAYFAAMFALVWLTGSRASLAAVALGVGWWLLRNRLPLLPRLVSFGLGIWVLMWFEETFSRIGDFADREGTDLLRAQIHAAEQVKLAGSAWFGDGFNTAWVDVTSFPHMWFHDSYAALLVEGGIPMFAVMLLLVGGVALGLLSRRQTVHPELRAAEGAIIVLLVCAWQLGEVFFTSIGFFVLGAALYERFGKPLVEEPAP